MDKLFANRVGGWIGWGWTTLEVGYYSQSVVAFGNTYTTEAKRGMEDVWASVGGFSEIVVAVLGIYVLVAECLCLRGGKKKAAVEAVAAESGGSEAKFADIERGQPSRE